MPKTKAESSRPSSIYQLNGGDKPAGKFNGIIYGTPGIGKTPFLGTADERMLILNSDHGVLSAESMGSKAHVWNVTDYNQLNEAVDFLIRGTHSYEWVSWDSITIFQDRVLVDDVLQEAHMENPRQSPDVASQREYLINHNRFGRYIRQLVGGNFNFIATAHVGVAEDENDELFYIPSLQGGKNGEIAKKTSGYFDVIGYYRFVKVKDADGKLKRVRRLEFEGKGFLARDRYAAFGKHVDNPTIPKLEKMIADSRSQKPKSSSNSKKKGTLK